MSIRLLLVDFFATNYTNWPELNFIICKRNSKTDQSKADRFFYFLGLHTVLHFAKRVCKLISENSCNSWHPKPVGFFIYFILKKVIFTNPNQKKISK